MEHCLRCLRRGCGDVGQDVLEIDQAFVADGKVQGHLGRHEASETHEGRPEQLKGNTANAAVDDRVSQAALARAHGEERRRVRRDLHDGLGPTLASIRLRLARRRHSTIDAEALDEIFEQVTDAIREVRRIVDGLQPSVLEDLGLVPALQILVNDTRDATALDITFESTGMTPELPADIAAAAYRSVAEALANVTRHSHATACTVHLTMAREDLRVEITDNGNGFQPTAGAAGMGLRSLQSRAAALGGTIDIASHVGEGTCVEVRLPT